MSKGDFSVKRGKRLAAEAKKKAKVKRILKDIWTMPDYTGTGRSDLYDDKKFVGKMAHTPHPCSGRCCGNPRCHCKGKDKLTLQEIKERENEKQEIQEAVTGSD